MTIQLLNNGFTRPLTHFICLCHGSLGQRTSPYPCRRPPKAALDVRLDLFHLIMRAFPLTSDRAFASRFLQIPPRNGHPCSWLMVGACQPPIPNFHRIDDAHAGRTYKNLKPLKLQALFYFQARTTLPVGTLSATPAAQPDTLSASLNRLLHIIIVAPVDSQCL